MPQNNPPLPVIDRDVQNAVRITHRYVCLGQKCQSSIDYITTLPFTPTFFTNELIATAWWNLHKANWRATVTADVRTDHIHCDDLTWRNEVGAQFVTLNDPDHQGANVGHALPPYCSYAFTKRTTFLGKRGRGSMRYSGVPEDAQDGGQFNAAYTVLMTAFGADLATPFNVTINAIAVGFNAALCRDTNAPVDPPIIQGAVLSAITVPRYVGTQNSRKIGVGM